MGVDQLVSGGDVDNPTYESLSTEQARITDPSIAPTGQSGAEGQLQTIKTSVSKTELFGSDIISWYDGDIYWPCLFPAGQILDDPLGEYYLYYSPDHASGGLGMAYSDSITGPFTDYGSDLPGGGNRWETPTVRYDPDNDEILVYYHSPQLGNNVAQATGLATSTDGINLTDQGAILDPNLPGFDHVGYFRPQRINGQWFGYHLAAQSSSNTNFAISYSYDGRNWRVDPKRLGWSQSITQDSTRRYAWNHSNLFRFNGTRYCVGLTRSSEYSESPQGEIVMSEWLSPTQLAGSPRPLITATESWEGSEVKTPSTYVEDGKLYIFYATNGDFAVAEVEGGVY
jgi:hypothetical protein